MKRKFLTAAMALTTLVMQSFAQDKPASNRKIELQSSFEKIVVDNGINIMLVDDEAMAVFAEGKSDCIKKISATVTDGVLTIKCSGKKTAKNVFVTVPVKKLASVVVSGNSIIESAGILNSTDLKVLVKGDCKLNLRTTGKVTIQYEEDYDFTFTKLKNPKMLKIEAL